MKTAVVNTRISNVSPPVLCSCLRLELLSASSRLEAMSIWRALELELKSTQLMCSSTWTETWLDHFGNQIQHQFLVAYRHGRPCGICLLTWGIGEYNGPCRVKSLHLGTAGEAEADSTCVEYNSMLVRPEDRVEFIDHLWKRISQSPSWDEFRLDGFCEAELTGWPVTDEHWSIVSKPSRYFDLEHLRNVQGETLAQLGAQTRAVIRQNLRKFGPFQCEWAETAAQAEQIFAEQIELHQIRWNAVGMPGCYASRTFREFHFDLLHRLVPKGQMGLFRVRNEQGTVGCAQVFIDNNRACLYQGGRRLVADHRVSTGVIVDYLLIEECRRRGLNAVDYLAGDSTHKRRLSTNSTPLVWAVYRRPRIKHRMVDCLRSVKRLFQSVAEKVHPTHAIAAELKSVSDDFTN